MKIEKISINNFKGIDRLEFEPRMINLIVGKNNTGKTSLLESIDLLFNNEKFRKYYEKHISDIINVNSKESEITSLINNKEIKLKLKKSDILNVGIAFKKELVEIIIKIIKRKKEVKFTVKIKREIEKILDTLINEELLLELSKESITVVKDGKEEIYFSFGSNKLRLMLGTVFESISKHMIKNFKIETEVFLIIYMLQREYQTHISENIPRVNENVIFIKELKIAGKEKINKEDKEKILEIEEYIKKYKLIKDLERFDLDYLSFKYNNKINLIPYDFMGDGFKAFVGMLWQFLSKTKKEIVLIEEPETHMHPGYIYELIKFLIRFSKEMNIQLFITSHNIDFIEGFYNEDLLIEYKEYLEKELLILKMEKLKNSNISDVLDYNSAESAKDDLLEDLRGI